jgi:hypothetical protein
MDTEQLCLEFDTRAMDSERNTIMDPEPTLDLQTDVKKNVKIS